VQGRRAERERQMLQLALRLSQDVGLLVRLHSGRDASGAAAEAASVQAAGAALLACARRLEGQEDEGAGDALRALAACPPGAHWAVDPRVLLREDLQKLLRVSQAAARAAAAEIPPPG
jgi:hypothetical protein